MASRFKAHDPITVPQCICKGGFRESCPYVVINAVDDFFAEKEPVDNLEEGHSDMVI